MGVKQSEEKKWSQALFSWVKGRIEKELQSVDGFEFVNFVRPGYIAGRPRADNLGKVSNFFRDIGDYFDPHLIKTKMAVHRDTISTAMVYAVLSDLKGPATIWENEEIKEQASVYRELLQKL